MILVPDKGSNSEAEDISDLDISDLSDSNRKSHGKFGKKEKKEQKTDRKVVDKHVVDENSFKNPAEIDFNSKWFRNI